MENLVLSVDVQNENQYNYEKGSANFADLRYDKKHDNGPSIYMMDYDGCAYESLVDLTALSELLYKSLLTCGLELFSVSPDAFVGNIARGTKNLLAFKADSLSFLNALETYKYGVYIDSSDENHNQYKTDDRKEQYNGDEYDSYSRNLKVGVENLGIEEAYFINAPKAEGKNSFFKILVELDEDVLTYAESKIQYTKNTRLTFSSAFNVVVSSGGVDSYITQDINGDYVLTDSIYFDGVDGLSTTNEILNVVQTIEEKSLMQMP